MKIRKRNQIQDGLYYHLKVKLMDSVGQRAGSLLIGTMHEKLWSGLYANIYLGLAQTIRDFHNRSWK